MKTTHNVKTSIKVDTTIKLRTPIKLNTPSIFRYAASAAMAFLLILSIGCQKEELSPKTGESLNRDALTVTATIESTTADVNSATQTKTYLDTDTWTAFWKNGDKIGITAIPASGTEVVNKPFTLSSGENSRIGIFAEDSPTSTWPTGEASYLMVYPYISSGTISGNPKVINLFYPNVQNLMTGPEGDFSSGVMAARVTSTGVPSFTFSNLFSIIKLSLTCATPTTITNVFFKDNSGKPVSGAYTLSIASDLVPVFPDTPADNPSKLIEIDLGAGILLNSEAKDIYIAVPPRTYSSGFTFIFETEGGEAMTKSKPSSVTLEKNKHYNMTAILTVDDRTDLSRMETANCYIVTGAGDYSFIANVIGNGTPGLLPQYTQAQKKFHTENVSITPQSAIVLWQDVEDLITNVSYANGKVSFTASSAKGNAVIAVYSGAGGTGDILWSWHIWCTDQPENETYITKDRSGEDTEKFPSKTLRLLDRNLGATSASIGEASYGLFYQWGRKDPFRRINPLIPTPLTTPTDDQSIAHTIANPATFYKATNASGYDWYYGAGTGLANRNNYLWGNPEGYNTNYIATKSIYDPCPSGYMVPPKDTWTRFTSTGGTTSTNSEFNVADNNFNHGWTFYTTSWLSGATSWYPAAGSRHYSDGSLSSSGSYGHYWGNSPYSSESSSAGYLVFGSERVSPLNYYFTRAYGFSVRCLRM